MVEGRQGGNNSTSVSDTTASTVDPFSVYRLPNLPIMTTIPKLRILPAGAISRQLSATCRTPIA